jgi:hypothetical protein
VYSNTFLADGDPASAYWPGGAILIEDGTPPQLLRLLATHVAAELSASPTA